MVFKEIVIQTLPCRYYLSPTWIEKKKVTTQIFFFSNTYLFSLVKKQKEKQTLTTSSSSKSKTLHPHSSPSVHHLFNSTKHIPPIKFHISHTQKFSCKINHLLQNKHSHLLHATLTHPLSSSIKLTTMTTHQHPFSDHFHSRTSLVLPFTRPT